MDGPNPCPSLREPQSQQEDEKERRWTLIIIRFHYTPCGRLSSLMSAFERTLKQHLVSYRNTTRQVTQTADLSHNYDVKLLLHPFNGFFSKTTWVSRYQKGKPVWI